MLYFHKLENYPSAADLPRVKELYVVIREASGLLSFLWRFLDESDKERAS